MAIAERHHACCDGEHRRILEAGVSCAGGSDSERLDSERPTHQECAGPQDGQEPHSARSGGLQHQAVERGKQHIRHDGDKTDRLAVHVYETLIS